MNENHAFITKIFPIHNATSLLVYTKKDNDNKNNLDYEILREIVNNNLKNSQQLKNYNEFIENLFKNKYDNTEISLSQINYFELNFSFFDKNKNILNYLSDFSFLIFIENKEQNLYIHFNNSTYNCNKDYEQVQIESKIKNEIEKILFCYSSIPLTINNKSKKTS